MDKMKRARLMLAIVAFGLLVSGVTIWPATWELELLVDSIWGPGPSSGVMHGFVLRVIEAVDYVGAEYPFLFYAGDWLAFAMIVLAILFYGARRDPVRNVWIVQCGLIMCVLIPVLAGICVPLRGLPLRWFWVDTAFAPAAGIPLWIALRDIRRVEKQAGAY
ncbi:MAG: hypothetical protein QGH94_07575 [Phycisphaerae bacterium]|jgi:hypothetical protein|nr:hypothetical protein [Phycisphaerae bacterium]MDP7287835.1 hypothetical protein [Phycisphaerae bacterium]